MPWFDILWTEEIARHIAEHGLTLEDVEEVLMNPVSESESRSSGLPVCWGFTPDGRYIAVIYRWIEDGLSIEPVTAYEV